MGNGNNPLTVQVTITSTSISVPANQETIAAKQGHTPIFWVVASGSAAGARITNVWFPVQAPPWPNDQPAAVGNGQWKVDDHNSNPGPGSQIFKYNIAGTTTAGTPPDLDPNVDNEPPPGGPPPEHDEDHDQDDQGSGGHGSHGREQKNSGND
jgi:hypothetical protein